MITNYIVFNSSSVVTFLLCMQSAKRRCETEPFQICHQEPFWELITLYLTCTCLKTALMEKDIVESNKSQLCRNVPCDMKS